MANVAKFVVTFDTTYDAMAFQSAAKDSGIKGRMGTVPRQLSAGCGMAWYAPEEERDTIQAFLEARGLLYEQLAVLE